MSKDTLIKAGKLSLWVVAIVVPGGLTALALYKAAKKLYFKGYVDGINETLEGLDKN